jgi:hypothetical protein
VGAGLEFILNLRFFSENADYNHYPGTDFFLYLDMGYTQPLGPIDLGFKMLYRLLPTSVDSNFGTGEISVSLGYRFPTAKKEPPPPRESGHVMSELYPITEGGDFDGDAPEDTTPGDTAPEGGAEPPR